MRGASAGSAERSRIVPREVGRRLQAETVTAAKRCSGSPKRSSDKGWTWNWRLARSCSGDEVVNRPSCEGAMVSGPRRKSAYSAPISARPIREW